jgi:hypothetical protein
MGLFGGAVLGGAVVAPLVYTVKNTGYDWASGMEGIGEMLFFGALGGVVGAVVLNVMAARVETGGHRARTVLVATILFMLAAIPGAALGGYLYDHGGPGTVLYPPDAPPKCRRPNVVTENCGGTMPYLKNPSDHSVGLWVAGWALVFGGSAAGLVVALSGRSSKDSEAAVAG